MAAGAPLIPEGALGIAALADLLVALLDILALGVLLGLLWTYKHTLGAVIQFLVDHTRIHTPFGSFSLLFPLESANNAILHGMSTAALGLEVAAGRMFHALGVIFGWMVNLALYSATTLAHTVAWFKHVHLPRYVKWAVLAAFPPALLAKLIADQVRKLVVHVPRIAHAVAHDATVVIYRPVKAFGRRLTKAEKAVVALAAAIAALGGHVIHPGHTLSLPKSWYGLTKRLAKLEKRMHRAEGWLAAGTLAVVMAQVLGVSVRCLRGQGNVARALRHICGVPRWLLDLFLLGTIEAFVATDLCAFTDLLITEAEALVPALMELVDVEDALIGCHGTVKPMTFALPDASLPPLQAASPLAA